ncbi:MAG: hypothetical protein AB7F89_16420 [Pirellulaceae bacterium]
MLPRRRKSGCRSGATRWALVLWLLYFLLDAPLPIGHQHVGEVAGTSWNAGLAAHLHRFHQQGGPRDWFAWHTHWVPASDWSAAEESAAGGEPVSAGDKPCLVAGPGSSPVPVLLAETFSDELPWADATRRIATVSQPGHTHARQFFDWPSTALTVRALFCIARC